MTEPEGVLGELLARCRADHRAWINGDATGYALPGDGSLLGAVGGFTFGGAETAVRQAAVAVHWRGGSGDVEYLNGGVADGLAWLTFIERAVVVFDNDAVEQRWELRVTEVFRRSGPGWERVHRHADPLVHPRPLRDVLTVVD